MWKILVYASAHVSLVRTSPQLSDSYTGPLKETFNDITRSLLEECSFCAKVDAVDIVPSLSTKTFLNKYAYTGRPVLVTNDKSFGRSPGFDFEFFKNLSKAKQLKTCQFFRYKTKFKTLDDALNMDQDQATLKPGYTPWYIGWNICDNKTIDIVKERIDIPSFLPENLAFPNSKIWIFIGTPGNGAPMHLDKVKYPSWQTQLSGSKKWTLQSPPKCIFSCRKHFEVTVHAGQLLILDTNIWYHQTKTIGQNISIAVSGEYK
ncbi:uncharacterized protein LOC126837161 [Adelges cooleyi]|uniref:uncharacterized protein LOC126837161 n=1 Tax=Adelges cooleyi TaxID=133065 RepID=UPI00217F3768|nr:uncharacterized protein LOC126837161 [Adelges cooleyi]